jgi:hypothetical protein
MPRRQSYEANETLVEFLSRELPPRRRDDVEYFAESIKEAGDRYDRYDERRADWEKYARRRASLRKLQHLSADLALVLCSLDILNHDDLASRTGPEKIDYLIGLLQQLNQHAGQLERETQVRGKPTDHATERWILDPADIFENAFSKPPKISGSGEDSASRRGRFYRLLELGRPSRFARHGRLSPKHVQTLLKLRGARAVSFEEFGRLSQEIARGAKTRFTRMAKQEL